MNIIFFILDIFSVFFLIAFTPIYFLTRKLSKKSTEGFFTKAGFIKNTKNASIAQQTVMFHGVSVGEVIALENLIKLAYVTFKDCKILITTGTKTGQDIAKKKYGEIAEVITYFPFDFPFSVRRFFKNNNPDLILMAETELWPCFASFAKKKKIPILLINGRISDDSFKTYKYFGWFFKHILSCYTGIYTQSEDDRQKFIKIGAPLNKTEVMKNLKFDIRKNTTPLNFNKGSEKILIAGSTHRGEDEIILRAFKNLQHDFPDLKLILAPRHLDRIPSIIDLMSDFKHGRRSQNDNFKENDVILLDTLGELSRMYSIADVAFIGGSFNNTGGHNPLEAVIYSKPVLSGPSVKNFKDIYALLCKTNAAKIVNSQKEFEEALRKLLSNKDFYRKASNDSTNIFESQKGAKDFVILKMKNFLLD